MLLQIHVNLQVLIILHVELHKIPKINLFEIQTRNGRLSPSKLHNARIVHIVWLMERGSLYLKRSKGWLISQNLLPNKPSLISSSMAIAFVLAPTITSSSNL